MTLIDKEEIIVMTIILVKFWIDEIQCLHISSSQKCISNVNKQKDAKQRPFMKRQTSDTSSDNAW